MKRIFAYVAMGLVMLSVRVPAATELKKATGGEAILPLATGLKPPRDHISLYTVRTGATVGQVTFVFVSGGKKLQRCQTDGAGRIDFQLDQVGEKVHILLIDNRCAFQEIADASGGEVYQAKLLDPLPDTGIVIITDKTKEITLPGAGKLQISTYTGGVDGKGIYLRGTKAVFRYPQWSPKNINPGIDVQRGEPFNIIDGAKKYEVAYQQLIPEKYSYLRYKPIKD